MSAYWDTSCLLKLYCSEPDSEIYLNLIQDYKTSPATSTLTDAELYYALLQKQRREETGGETAEVLFKEYLTDKKSGIFFNIPIGEEIPRIAREIADACYAASQPVYLRSLDGIHLASALYIDCKKLVSSDRRMNEAARLLGLEIVA